jgi:hypothetical protein
MATRRYFQPKIQKESQSLLIGFLNFFVNLFCCHRFGIKKQVAPFLPYSFLHVGKALAVFKPKRVLLLSVLAAFAARFLTYEQFDSCNRSVLLLNGPHTFVMRNITTRCFKNKIIIKPGQRNKHLLTGVKLSVRQLTKIINYYDIIILLSETTRQSRLSRPKISDNDDNILHYINFRRSA